MPVSIQDPVFYFEYFQISQYQVPQMVLSELFAKWSS